MLLKPLPLPSARSFSLPISPNELLNYTSVDHLFSGGTPVFSNQTTNKKCKHCNDVFTLAQKYSPAFKKTAVNLECAMQES